MSTFDLGLQEATIMSSEQHMREALALARDNIKAGGRPFGAVLIYRGQVIARAVNEIHSTQDPTCHAEMQAIRQASRVLGRPDLDGCEIYASGHPALCAWPQCTCAVSIGRGSPIPTMRASRMGCRLLTCTHRWLVHPCSRMWCCDR